MGQRPPGIGLLGHVAPASVVLDLAREIEDAGFADAWVVEYEYDAMAFCQAIAAATETAGTGTCITRAFTRHPISIADTAAVIDSMAPGRFTIGLGTGPLKAADPRLNMQRWGQEWDRPVARMREYVQIVRRVLEGETLNYEGEFFDLANVGLDVLPAGKIPIYLAAGGERMTEVAGAEADGVFVHLANRAMTEQTLDRVARAAKSALRDPDSVELSNLIMTCVDDESAVARDAMRHWLIDFYLNMPSYQKVLERSGYADTANAIRDLLAKGDLAGAAAAVPDGVLDDFTIVGTPAECEQKLAEFVAWGTSVPILYPFPSRGDWIDGYRRTIDAFAPARQIEDVV